MASHITFCRKIIVFSIILSSLGAIALADEKANRWSRQISNTGFLNDWIPVAPLQQRQVNGRVLNHFGPPVFPPPQNNVDGPIYQPNQQAPPPQPPHPSQPAQSNLGEPFQRVFFQQMHPQNLPLIQNQQQLHVTNLPSTPFRLHHDMLNAGPLNTGPQQFLQIQHPQPEFRFPHFNQPNKPELIQFNGKPEFPQFNQLSKPEFPQFQLPPQKPEFIRNEPSLQQAPRPEQLVQNEPSLLKNNGIEVQAMPVEQVQPIPPQEEVQLLYVPLDTLYNQQQEKLQNTRYNVLPSPVNPLQINNFYQHHQKFPPPSTAAPTTPTLRITTSTPKYRVTTQKPPHRFSFSQDVKNSEPKPKSHQPPLAMFMKNMLSFSNKPSVSDVLSNLAFAKGIDVLDSVATKNSPDVFIGPLGLNTPDGYTKFELPYLSNLEQNRAERQINGLPFFVAPLSYRAPKGFAKIPLPQPHVGSVVVNSPNLIELQNSDKGSSSSSFFSDTKYHPPSKRPIERPIDRPIERPVEFISFSTASPDRPRTATTSRFRYSEQPVSKPNYQSETEIITTTPTTTNSFNAFKTTTAYKPFSESVNRHPFGNNDESEQTFNFGNKHHGHSSFYTTVSPSKPTVEEFKFNDDGPSKFILSNAQAVNSTAYPFKNDEPSNSFGSFFTQTPTSSFFNTPEAIVTTKQPESAKYEITNIDEPTRYKSYVNPTVAPITSTLSSVSATRDDESYRNDEVEKMKSYFREQDAFKSRQPIAVSTPAAYYESSTAGTISTEKGYNEYSTIPSKLSYFTKEPKNHQNVVTTPRTTVTYYTAAAASDESENQRFKGHSAHKFRFVESVLNGNKADDSQIQSTPRTEEKYPQHDQFQYNEVYSTSPRYETTRTPYRESQTVSPIEENTAMYNIPSELSPIGSNLPGLVNSLMEKDSMTTPPTVAPIAVTTRRTNTIRRRPPTTPKNHQIDETSPPEITTRRPVNRGRRPVNYANRTSTVRTSTVRSVNRFRYTPTAEDRARQRVRTRPTTRPTKEDKEEENIDYQRDVLKQNYPVITRTEKSTTKSIESSSDSNKLFTYNKEPTVTPVYYEVTSATLKDQNIGQKFYGNKDDIQKTNVQEEQAPVFVSTTTVASIQTDDNQEEITEVLRTRKPSFIRRVPSSTVKSTTSKLVASDYDASRTKERNAVSIKQYAFHKIINNQNMLGSALSSADVLCNV